MSFPRGTPGSKGTGGTTGLQKENIHPRKAAQLSTPTSKATSVRYPGALKRASSELKKKQGHKASTHAHTVR